MFQVCNRIETPHFCISSAFRRSKRAPCNGFLLSCRRVCGARQPCNWLQTFLLLFISNWLTVLILMHMCTYEVCHLYSGVDNHMENIKSGKEKELTAQILDVVCKVKKLPYLNPNSLYLKHSHFAKSDIVLRPNVQLLCIEEDQAKFMEFDPEIDLFDTRRFSSISVAQADHVKKIIIIPRWELNRLVSDIDIGNREVVWLFHTPGSGAMLWAKIFSPLPNWTVISENQTLLYSLRSRTNTIDMRDWLGSKDNDEMVIAMVKLYCALAPRGNNIFWSETAGYHIIPVLQKRFPHHRFLFAYRDAVGAGKSYVQTFSQTTMIAWYVYRLLNPNLGPKIATNKKARQAWLWFTHGHSPNLCLNALRELGRNPQLMEWTILLWACIVSTIKEFQHHGFSIKSIKFDDLLDSPHQTISELFQHLSIPSVLVWRSLDAMKQHIHDREGNQKNTSPWIKTEESVRKCNTILRVFNLPDLHTTCNM